MRHVVIVGGGASGALLVCHLLRSSFEDIKVTLIERNPAVGRGTAYSTANPTHLLNVRASNMSAFTDDPEHFWRWLQANGLASPNMDHFSFVSRRTYGSYVADLLETSILGSSNELTTIHNECVSIESSQDGAVATLTDGSSIIADIVVLATGNDIPQTFSSDGLYGNPWTDPTESRIPKDSRVLILGTGLTMVDYVQSLLHCRHDGPIVALSRHGLLPRAHRRVAPFPIDDSDVPYGCDISQLLGWFRAISEETRQQGGDWRGIVDGMRPFTQQLWQSLSVTSRRRFLRHARSWWDVHRHRMAPEVANLIENAISSGQLTIVAAKLQTVERNDCGATVTFRPRACALVETLQVSRIVECTGISKTPLTTTNPALRSLLKNGLARVDPLGISLDTTNDGALINAAGIPSDRMFAVGPLTRSAFWEIVAVPDIRVQCRRLADLICARLKMPRD